MFQIFKTGDLVSFTRHEASTQRLPRKNEKLPANYDGGFIIEPGKPFKQFGRIGLLTAFYIPIRLANNEVRHTLYANLTFLKGNKCSFKSKLPDWKGVVKDEKGIYVETIKPGKLKTLTGETVLRGLPIPVKVDKEAHVTQIPYEKLTFEKETK